MFCPIPIPNKNSMILINNFTRFGFLTTKSIPHPTFCSCYRKEKLPVVFMVAEVIIIIERRVLLLLLLLLSVVAEAGLGAPF